MSGTLNLETPSVITDLLRTDQLTANIPSIAVSTTHSDDVYIASRHRNLPGLNVLESSLSGLITCLAVLRATSEQRSIGIASNGDSTVQIVRNTLLNIVGTNIDLAIAWEFPAPVLRKLITQTGNRIAQLSGGTTLPCGFLWRISSPWH